MTKRNNDPLISIVIPSYNKVKYVSKTLDSIFKQSYKNFEVIIQDGASNDGTVEIIKKYQKKYPKQINLVSKKDDGQLDAINKGLKKAKGEIVTFINTDDTYEKDTLFTVVQYYKENPDSLWFAGKCKIIDEDGNEIAKFWTNVKNILLNINNYSLLLFTSNYLSQPSVFITREAYKKYGPFTGTKKFVYEYDLWLTLGKIKMPVCINKYLSNFRISKDNKVSVYYNELFKYDEKVVKKHTKNKIVLLAHKSNNSLRIITRFII